MLKSASKQEIVHAGSVVNNCPAQSPPLTGVAPLQSLKDYRNDAERTSSATVGSVCYGTDPLRQWGPQAPDVELALPPPWPDRCR